MNAHANLLLDSHLQRIEVQGLGDGQRDLVGLDVVLDVFEEESDVI
jgi:hypothetical protein